jgi:hypothetical protein
MKKEKFILGTDMAYPKFLHPDEKQSALLFRDPFEDIGNHTKHSYNFSNLKN